MTVRSKKVTVFLIKPGALRDFLKDIDLVSSGKGVEEIVKELEGFVPQVHAFVMF